jgi:hypothetical protein
MGQKCRAFMSGFLFAVPSFLEGMARAVDLGGVFDRYNASSSGEEADIRAMSVDWQAVGCDLRQAVKRVESELR